MKKPVFLIPGFLFLLCITGLGAQNNQKIYPLESDIYNGLTALYLEQGFAPPSGARPFSGDEIREALERIDTGKLSSAGYKTYLYIRRRLKERVLYGEKDGFAVNGSIAVNLESYLQSNEHYDDWEYGYKERLPMFGLTLEMWALKGFYAIMDFSLQKEPFVVSEDPYNHSNIITDLTSLDAHFPYRGFLSAGGNHWNIQFGRDLQSWGNGYTGNLLLSDNLEYHDALRFTTYWDAFKFSTIFLSLENWDDEDIHEMADISKNFIGHRLEFRFFKRFTLSVSEGMMFSGKYLEPRYLNPFMVYHNYMINDRYGNIVFSVEANINPYRWINLYGQLLLDTLTAAYEKERYSEAIPQANGYLLGAESDIPLGPGYLSAGFEWALADPWLYMIEGQPDYIVERRFLSNYLKDLEFIEKVLGYEYAPDARVLSFSAGYNVFGFFGINTEVKVIEKGEITIDTPYRSDEDAAALKAPSGRPEKKVVTHIQGELTPVFLPWDYVANMITLKTDLYFIHISNFEHMDGKIVNDVQWTLSLSVNL